MPKIGMEPIRRSQIINATLECICLEGIEKMSLDTVAKEAKCSKGVISYYFKSKDNLILESFRAFLNYYKTKIDSEVSENMTPFEMLKVVQKNSLPQYYNTNNENECKLNVSEIEGIELMTIPSSKKAKLFVNFFSRAMIDINLQSALQDIYRIDHNGISKIIHYGNKMGTFKKTDTNESAYAVMALYIGLSMLRAVGFKPEEVNDDIDVFWSVVNSIVRNE